MEMDALIERVGILEGRIDEHHQLFEALNGRMGSIEKRMESIERRIDGLDVRIVALDSKVDTKISELYSKISELDSKAEARTSALDSKMARFFTWMIGLLMTSWLSILTILLTKF